MTSEKATILKALLTLKLDQKVWLLFLLLVGALGYRDYKREERIEQREIRTVAIIKSKDSLIEVKEGRHALEMEKMTDIVFDAINQLRQGEREIRIKDSINQKEIR